MRTLQPAASSILLATTLAAAKSRFLAAISHEIGTPLNGVLGMADLMTRTDLNEKQAAMLSTIRASGDLNRPGFPRG